MNLTGFFTEYLGSSLETIVWSLFIGIVVASGLTFYHKQILGGFVRELVANNAQTPETARTLADAGYSKNVFVKHALRPKSMFRKIVRLAGAEEIQSSKVDFENARFYVPKELEDRVELQYSGGGTTLLSVLMSFLVFLLVAVLSLVLIPILTDFITTMFEGFVSNYN